MDLSFPKTTNPCTKIAKRVTASKYDVVSVKTLLMFINSKLDCQLRGIGDLKTGAVYCQLMHRLFPESIQIQKVKFYTNAIVDFQLNYRLLNNCFEKLSVTVYMPVHELTLGQNQVVFCNWMYKFYEANDNGNEYDAKKVRKGSPIGLDNRACSSNRSSTYSIHKCQSLVFNYGKKPARFERQNSLDALSSRPGIFKSIRRENPEPQQRKNIEEPSQFLAESKHVSLPSDSEDELELKARRRYLLDRFLKMPPKRKNDEMTDTVAPSKTSEIPIPKPEIRQLKRKYALCDKYEQDTKDRRSNLGSIEKLQLQLQNLQIDKERLGNKLSSVESILKKCAFNPAKAVLNLNKLILNNHPQTARVHPLKTDTVNDEGLTTKEEFKSCTEFSRQELKYCNTTSLSSEDDEHIRSCKLRLG
ncbi:uncharacterized protein LOC117137343 [Drosophila mauritiana]|uniref:Uncharacterized protein LOC117137343 n=1 Tax=Drosophila mauritiana TaxID=7226 RepID=A0A6P8JEP2_DROMA|nr:uncharacterized protein LOC117137343 [Drosophila mauritiana]